MKKYGILVSYEERGIITVKANSLKEAEDKAEYLMAEHGLDKKRVDFNCKDREYYTHGER